MFILGGTSGLWVGGSYFVCFFCRSTSESGWEVYDGAQHLPPIFLFIFFCKKFRETYCHHLLSVPKKTKNPCTNLISATRPSPLLITKDAVASMKAGSVIVDLVPQSLSQTFFWVTWNPPTPRWCRFAYFFFQGHKWMQELYSTV